MNLRSLSTNVLLLCAGSLLLVLHAIFVFSLEVQLVLFLAGVLVLGIPHGAADVVVASINARSLPKPFSAFRFLIRYLLQLLLFSLGFYFFPLWATLLFVLLAAFHFGETDLHYIRVDSLAGKALAMAYGLMILGLILLVHLPEIRPILSRIDAAWEQHPMLQVAEHYQASLIYTVLFLFFGTAFLYFRVHPGNLVQHERMLTQLLLLFFLLYGLPFLLGFSFYFIGWHSLISLQRISAYIREHDPVRYGSMLRQMGVFSLLAIGGIVLLVAISFFSFERNALVTAVLLGLAALTAPHMEVMHAMYVGMKRAAP